MTEFVQFPQEAPVIPEKLEDLVSNEPIVISENPIIPEKLKDLVGPFEADGAFMPVFGAAPFEDKAINYLEYSISFIEDFVKMYNAENQKDAKLKDNLEWALRELKITIQFLKKRGDL